jgi:hypothetical protein
MVNKGQVSMMYILIQINVYLVNLNLRVESWGFQAVCSLAQFGIKTIPSGP